MKAKNALFLGVLIIFSFFLWNCSSHHQGLEKIKGEIPPPALPEIQKPEDLVQKELNPIPVEEKDLRNEDLFVQEKYAALEKEGPSALMEEALNSYQDAQSCLDRGDFDAALAALDEAYNLILKAKIPPDSSLVQEKNDLRILIAQRIQQIYASQLKPVGDIHKTIPLEENKWILGEIEHFQTDERKNFEEAYVQSGLYREMILEELKRAGLPEQLSWLPLIESGFKVRALSRARALGLWQFISSTGLRFGLKRDRWVDERMDPLKSTQAAIKFLTELHSLFGDWTTALASYNCGEIRIQNVIRYQRINYLDNFWDLFINLPYETARFVPRFIATLLIINNPEKYGFNLPIPLLPLRYETITINHPVKLSSLAASLGLEASELAYLNPELRHDATPDYEYQLKVPLGYGEEAQTAVSSLPRWIPPEASFFWHYVRRGETLSIIASRYRTSVSAIARLNGLRSLHLIWPGQRLKIPGSAKRRNPNP